MSLSAMAIGKPCLNMQYKTGIPLGQLQSIFALASRKRYLESNLLEINMVPEIQIIYINFDIIICSDVCHFTGVRHYKHYWTIITRVLSIAILFSGRAPEHY